MKFEEVKKGVEGIPFISVDNGKLLYDFILEHKPKKILELGVGYGTSSCYIAAALDELGTGKLTCVDLESMKDHFKPSLEQQIADLKLTDYVEVHRMQSGYNWFLHDSIARNSMNADKVCQPEYDLIFIDGPKNWIIDSSSFFLADKLLNDKGWILWDDYNWKYENASDPEMTDGVSHRSMSTAEMTTAHIKEIFHLLVMQHPSYGNFKIHAEEDWAWAQKIKQDHKHVKYVTSRSFKSILMAFVLKFKRRLFK